MSIPRLPRSRILLAVLASTMIFSMSMSSGSGATTLGVVADNSTGNVVVFDADANVVIGHIALAPTGVLGDCAVTADATQAFVTDFQSRIWVIDLTTSPPSLASGTNPISISNYGEDVAITPDQRFLVITDGSAFQPISVVDIAARVEIHAVQLPNSCNSIDVSSDGSVLVTTLDGYVNRLTIDGSGNLTPTGERLLVGEPNNVYPAPDGLSGVVVLRGPPEIHSFTFPGLAAVSTRSLSGVFGICAVVTADRVFARSNAGYVDAFSYDAAGQMGASPLYSIPISDTPTFYGMDQMALHPNGTRLYVPQPSAVNVYDAASGVFLAAITDAALVSPSGISFGGVSDQPPDCAAAAALVPVLWPPDHGLQSVSIVGVTDPDGDPVTITVTGVTQDEPLDDLGDGNTCPDAALVDGVGQVRAERSGRGNGRVYAIAFTASDGRGGTSQGTVTVSVPHDQDGAPAIDDGQTVNALGDCDHAGHELLRPRRGAVLTLGAPYTVQYQVPAGIFAADVGLLHSMDHGTHWVLDRWNQPCTGEIQWTVPYVAADSVLVAVAELSVGDGGTYQVIRMLGESDYFSIGSSVAVADAPGRLELAAIQPNPTAGNARIRFGLQHGGDVAVHVFDVHGRKVKTVMSAVRGPGWHEVSWEGDTDSGGRAGAGLYFIRLHAEQQELTQRVIRLN